MKFSRFSEEPIIAAPDDLNIDRSADCAGQNPHPIERATLVPGWTLIPTVVMADSSGHCAGWYRARGWPGAARKAKTYTNRLNE